MNETEGQALDRFFKAVLAKIEERRGRYKRFGWRDPEYKTMWQLIRHLFSEVWEFLTARTVEQRMSELVDIAAIAFFIWDRLRIEK